MEVISDISQQQKNQIPLIFEKWQSHILNTDPIQRGKAAEAVKQIYLTMNLPEPKKIFFYPSPKAVWNAKDEWMPYAAGISRLPWWEQSLTMTFGLERLETKLVSLENQRSGDYFKYKPVTSGICIERSLLAAINTAFFNLKPHRALGILSEIFCVETEGMLETMSTLDNFRINEDSRSCHVEIEETMFPEPPLHEVAVLDFCTSILGCDCNWEHLNAVKGIVRECGVLLTLYQTCIVCERPNWIATNDEIADGEKPVLVFPDGQTFFLKDGMVTSNID